MKTSNEPPRIRIRMRTRGRHALGPIIGLLLLAFALLCPSQSEAADTIRLQLRWQHQFQFAGYYLACDRGYYAAAGLDVILVDTKGDLEPIAEVTEGRATYGIGSSDLVLARAHGKKVVALAAIFQHSPLVLLALRSSGIDSVHDLAGKRVAIEHEAADLVGYLQSEGLSASSYRQRPHAQNVKELLEGRVDAMSAYQSDEPFELEAANQDVRVFSPRAGGIDFYGDTLFTSEAEVEQHPDRVDAMIRASKRGWEDALDDPGAGIDAVLRRSQRHSRAHLEYEAIHTAPLIAADIVELGYMNPARWQHIADTYVSLSLIPSNTDLRGLVYRAPAQPLPPWVYAVLAGSLAIAAVIGAGWLRTRNLARALAVATHRWRTFIEASPLPMVVVGDDGALLYENTRAKALTTPEQGGLDLIRLIDRPAVAETLRDGLTHASTSEVEVSVDTEGDPHGATRRWLLLSAALSEVAGARGLLISIIDVTAQKELVRSLRRNAEIEAAIAAGRADSQRRLLAILSHEFRNPLAGIDRAANLLEIADDPSSAVTAKRLAGIRAQVGRLNMLVDSILSTDPVDVDSLRPRMKLFEVGPFLENLRDAMSEEMAERVQLVILPAALTVSADPRLLALALSNLVDNALRYAPADTPVCLRSERRNGMIVIDVLDEGPGLNPEDLPHVGTPHRRNDGTQQGTGLGYYFSKTIAEAHGGAVVAENRPTGGLAVSLQLPAPR